MDDLIELEGRGDFSEEKLSRPSKDFWACRIPVHVFFCIVWMGRKGGRWKSRSTKAEKPESVRR